MAVSLNSVLRFSASFQAKHQNVFEAAVVKLPKYPLNGNICFSPTTERRWRLSASVSESNQLPTDPNKRGVEPDSSYDSIPNQGVSDRDPALASNLNQDSSTSSNVQSTPKRVSLTARERLRAARVLSRYSEAKTSDKPKAGSKLLDVLKESDKGKKKGLPEAPTNLFDDSKRGLPKPGLTFDFPGGSDLLLIAFSVVFISTVMFTTTYIVWKAGAIHFNEY